MKCLTEVNSDDEISSFRCFDRKLFRCSKCGITWRLVEPDFPFVGNWSQVYPKDDIPEELLNDPSIYENDWE